MGILKDMFTKHSPHDEWPDIYNTANRIGTAYNYDAVLANMGYEKIEENELLAKYRKVELYGRKTVDIYLSMDKVALIKCYDQFTGEAMALTAAEINIFCLKLQQKVREDWTDIVVGS